MIASNHHPSDLPISPSPLLSNPSLCPSDVSSRASVPSAFSSPDASSSALASSEDPKSPNALHASDFAVSAFSQQPAEFRKTLQMNFCALLNDPELADIHFTIAENEPDDDENKNFTPLQIHAHKNILAARCRPFAAMFRSGMVEATSGNVVVRDTTYQVFYIMLEYLYTGVLTAKASESDLLSLIELAEQYQLAQLKRLCEKRLIRLVDQSNLAQFIETASNYSLSQLLETCQNFQIISLS